MDCEGYAPQLPYRSARPSKSKRLRRRCCAGAVVWQQSQGDSRMRKSWYLAGGVIVTAVLALSPAGAQDKKTPTIKEVMKKLNAGPNSMTATLGKELQDDPPAWDDIKQETKEYLKFAEA